MSDETDETESHGGALKLFTGTMGDSLILQSMLESAGIKTYINKQIAVNLLQGKTGLANFVDVIVPKAQEAQAREVLAIFNENDETPLTEQELRDSEIDNDSQPGTE